MQTSRYGAPIRRLVKKAIRSKLSRYECPKCRKLKLTRKGTALWACRSCDAVIAGAAYSFRSEAGEIAMRIISEYAKSS